jgi:putative DNA-invertase from lambdoid prophage Rac
MANRIRSYSAPDRQPAVYGYCRVSAAEQRDNGISLAEQQRRIEGRALEQGWTLTELFVEGGVSGPVPFAKRPQGGRLIRRLLPGDIVISPKLDRCFRSALDALATISDFKARQIHLWLLDLGGDCSDNGISELMLTVLAAVAQFERTRLAERILDAKAELCRTGRHQGGTKPFGWRLGPPAGKGTAPVLYCRRRPLFGALHYWPPHG